MQIQEVKFREQVKGLSMAGLGARGMKKAIAELHKIYGIE
jgi:hypothetical protein